MMTKRNILLLTVALLAGGSIAQEVKITHPSIVREGNQATVSFQAEIEKISTNEMLLITPVLYAPDQQKSLKPIIVMGRNKRIAETRQIGGHNGGTERKVAYQVTVPFEKWMYSASLRIDREVSGCCNERMLAPLNVAIPPFIRPEAVPAYSKERTAAPLSEVQKLGEKLPYLLPMSDYQAAKGDFNALREKGSLIVHFIQGSSAIDLSYRENKQSLEQVKRILQLIEDDPNATLGKIVVVGGASPEGAASVNDRMAGKRASALKEYLRPGVDPNVFDLINLGEDWTGLHKMVEASSMPDKELVLQTMDKYSILGGREVELMKLKGGRPYNYMMKEFFPELRTAGYIQIFYESTPDTEFVNTHKAIELINQKEYGKALEILRTLSPTGDTNNLTGVCHLMLDEEERAVPFFQKAIEAGNQDAAKNLQQINR